MPKITAELLRVQVGLFDTELLVIIVYFVFKHLTVSCLFHDLIIFQIFTSCRSIEA